MEASNAWLDEVEFPAMKTDLIDAAVEADAAQELVERLQALDHEQYETREELQSELAADDN